MTNPFIKTAKEAKERGEKALANRITIEGRIVSRIIESALENNMMVSVYDGEEYAVRKSLNKAEIIEGCFSTDEDTLVFHDKISGSLLGKVFLVYGNDGYDVISDHSQDYFFDNFMKPIAVYASTFE